MTLLELIVKNGRKWALISKFLTGRNEHSVKNRYISILRFLKKKGKKVNPNHFQEVLDAFKQVQKEISSCKNPLILQVLDEVDEFPLEFLQQNEEFFDGQKLKEAPNLKEIFNPTQKEFGMEEDYFTRSYNNSFNRKSTNINCSCDIESISQKLNRNMADQSDNNYMINLFSNPDYSHERSNIFANVNSIPIEKPIQYLKAKDDPMFDMIPEHSGKNQIFLSHVYEQNVMYDFEWDRQVNTESGERSRCKTQRINDFDIQGRLTPMMNVFRK